MIVTFFTPTKSGTGMMQLYIVDVGTVTLCDNDDDDDDYDNE